MSRLQITLGTIARCMTEEPFIIKIFSKPCQVFLLMQPSATNFFSIPVFLHLDQSHTIKLSHTMSLAAWQQSHLWNSLIYENVSSQFAKLVRCLYLLEKNAVQWLQQLLSVVQMTQYLHEKISPAGQSSLHKTISPAGQSFYRYGLWWTEPLIFHLQSIINNMFYDHPDTKN